MAALELKLTDTQNTSRVKTIIQQMLEVEAHVAENGTITAPMRHPDVITDLLLALRNQQIQLAEVSVKSPTLDEVFLTLTGQNTEDITEPITH